MSFIDKTMAAHQQWFGTMTEKGYQPDQAVTSVYCREVPDAKTMTIVFPPWGGSHTLDRVLHRRLAKERSSVLQVNLSELILHSDIETVKESFDHSTKQVVKQVADRDIYSRYKTINLIGFSLGNVILSMAAEDIERFDDVTMVVPGTELATPLWTGIRTRALRETYQKRGYDLSTLRREWSNLAPIAHLPVLEGHEVAVVLSAKDQYIPYSSGLELVETMRQSGLQPTLQTSQGGHIETIMRFAFNGSKFDSY